MKKIIVFLSLIIVFLASCQANLEPEIDENGDISQEVDETTADDEIDAEKQENRGSGSPDGTVVHENDGSETDQEVGFSGISKVQCEQAGGHWNECGSPCAGTDADFCIEMCQVQCECGGIAGFACPDGYECRLSGEIVDEMGVCIEN